MSGELSDRVALVTGGGKGIGAAICRALAAMGAKVHLNYRSDAASAEQLAGEIGGAAVRCDVTDGAAVESMIKGIGRVDILVNNAGAVRDKLLLRMTDADWNDIIATDLTAAFHTTKATLAGGMLRNRWGRIVNIASIVGITGNPGQANYAAAKAGLIGFTKAIAKEVGSRGITANAVAPGYVRTELTSGSLTDEMVAELVKFTPLQREGTPEDVAAAVAFLCSPAAGFITAHTLVVDGGLSV
ncbi:MAG TPA: 3-oxoacyl-ACP reductase FabG [Candidatus Dormibacteraeota bacterium]|nr:3-oxoacyl-ACP reductase FabG [Candidatus Dormibacteraeota bacterium]